MKKNLIVAIAIALILNPAMVWAEADLFVPPDPPPPPPKPTNQNTINRGSNVGQNSQKSGQGANNAAGAALIAAGSALLPNPPTAPQGAMLIALGIIALAQGAHDGDAAGQSANTGSASVYNNPTDTQKNEAKDYEKGKSAFNTPEIKKALDQIKDKGYDVSESGIKLPNGSKIPLSALSSPGAMAAAGISPDVIKKVGDVSKDVAQQYSVSSVAVGNGGGGGGNASGMREGTNDGESSSVGKAFNPFDLGADQRKGLLAGKTVNLDGEPIGVAGANIFEMIHQAYQKKRTGDQFLETEEAHGTRAPASTRNAK